MTTESCEGTADPAIKSSWRALFHFTTNKSKLILLPALVSSLAAGIIGPLSSYLIGKIFQQMIVSVHSDINQALVIAKAYRFVVFFAIVGVASLISRSLSLMLWLTFGELQAKHARDILFKMLLYRSMEWYDTRGHDITVLLPRYHGLIRDLQFADAQPLALITTEIASSVLSLVLAFYYSWDLTLVILAVVPAIVLVVFWLSVFVQQNLRKQQKALDETQMIASGALTAVDTVKCFNGQFHELNNFSDKVGVAAFYYRRIASLSAAQMAVVIFLSTFMCVIGFYYGAVLVSHNKGTAGDIVTTFLACIEAFQGIQSILPQLVVLEKGRLAGAALKSITMNTLEERARSYRHPFYIAPRFTKDLELRNLSFAYPSRPDLLVLDEVNILIRGGETTYILGKSGSGKSTIGQLLLGLYEVPPHTIFIDHIPTELFTLSDLRSNITLVEQDVTLFHDTLFHNISCAVPEDKEAIRDEIRDATTFALLQHVIADLPDGIETTVGTNGTSLSGGQRQRVALARAKLRDPPVLILDESTSALDHINRGLMFDAIKAWRSGRTTVVITHDLTQIGPDDNVVVLEQGRVVCQGKRFEVGRVAESQLRDFTNDGDTQSISPSMFSSRITCPPIQTPLPDESLPSQTGDRKRASRFLQSFQDPLYAISPLLGGRNSQKITVLKLPDVDERVPGDRLYSHSTQSVDTELVYLRQQEADVSHSTESLVERTGRRAAENRLGRTNRRFATRTATSRFQSTGADSGVPGLTQRSPEKLTLFQIMRSIWPRLNRKERFLLIGGFAAAAVHAVGTPVFSFLLSKLVQTYSDPSSSRHKALEYSLIMFGVSFVDATNTYASHVLLEMVGQVWVDRIRSEAFIRVLHQAKSFFDQPEHSVANLCGDLGRNAEEMRNLVGRFAGMAFTAAVITLVSVVWALVSSWKTTLLSMLVVPLIWLATQLQTKISGRWESHCNRVAEMCSAHFTETFTHIKTIRILTLESHFWEKHIQLSDQVLHVGLRRSLYTGLCFGLSESSSTFATTMIFYIGLRLAQSDEDVNDIITVFVLLMFAIIQVGSILAYMPQIGNAQDTASRVLSLACTPYDPFESRAHNYIGTTDDIIFDNVSFSYPSRPDATVLQGLNLHLPRGSTTAIVGSSGSGKSTLISLLLKLYNTTQGEILVDGQSLRTISTSSLRRLVVPVLQAPKLFATTVAKNITYGLPEDSPYNCIVNVMAAAYSAGIEDFIRSLPQGYETMLGDGTGGVGLSGGQIQRLALARALVREPQVLLLDEPTAGLDMQTAAHVRESLRRLGRQSGMTIVAVTHSREMMEIADRVVVLEKGRVVESGRFEQLMGRQGALRNLLSGGVWRDSGEDEVGDRQVV